MHKTQNLINDDIPSLIKKLAIPASTGLFFNTMYNVVDTFYAGLISTQAVSALTLSFIIYFLIIGFGYGFSSATTALLGNAFGKKRYKLASIYAHKSLIFIPMIGIFLSTIGFFVAPSLFTLLGASGEYLDTSMTYIIPILFGSLFFMLNFSLNAILVAQGNTKTYRNTLIFGFFANMLLNPLFIYGFLFIPSMGIQGIAIATVLIQVLNMIYLFYKVVQTKIIHFKKLEYFLPNFKIYNKLLFQGLPVSLNILTMAFGSLILTYYVSHYNMYAVAGYGIGFRVEQIMLLPALGISTAVLTLVSNNYGAKKYDRVIEILRTALKFSFIISTLGIILLIIFGKLIISQFDSNEIVIQYGLDYILVEVWGFYAYVILFVCVSTLQGIKKPKMILFIGLYRQIIAKLAISYIVVKYFELDYIYLWIGIVFVIYSAAIFAYLYTNKLLKENCNLTI